ncbi:MAG: transcriptional regulator domain-containing protein [Methylovirgula sp.]
MPKEDWRSPTAYDYTRDLNSSEFAWEFLRRNPDYRADFSNDRTESVSEESLGRRWGLRFPERPSAESRRNEDLLAPGTQRKRRDPRGSPG